MKYMTLDDIPPTCRDDYEDDAEAEYDELMESL